MKKHIITIEYCPKCNWLLRAAYMAQELLTTFEDSLEAITLKPSETNGKYTISTGDIILFDRKINNGFAEIKEIKQWVRDMVAPEQNLGHADKK
jgi:selenoprotein W-related protein